MKNSTMKKFNTITALFLLISLGTSAQSVFYEDFENGVTTRFIQDYVFGTLDWVNDPNAVTLGPSPATFEVTLPPIFLQEEIPKTELPSQLHH